MTSKRSLGEIYKYFCKDSLSSKTFNPYKKVKASVVSLPKLPDKFFVKESDDTKLIDIYNEKGKINK